VLVFNHKEYQRNNLLSNHLSTFCSTLATGKQSLGSQQVEVKTQFAQCGVQ
jgi:hypothetical protein